MTVPRISVFPSFVQFGMDRRPNALPPGGVPKNCDTRRNIFGSRSDADRSRKQRRVYVPNPVVARGDTEGQRGVVSRRPDLVPMRLALAAPVRRASHSRFQPKIAWVRVTSSRSRAA